MPTVNASSMYASVLPQSMESSEPPLERPAHRGIVYAALATLVTALLMAMFMSPFYALSSVAVAVCAIVFLFTGHSRSLPQDPMGLFVCLILILLPLAPALGGGGTVVRSSLALVSLVLLFLRFRHIRSLRYGPQFGLLVLSLGIVLLGLWLFSPAFWYGASRYLNWVMFLPLGLVVATYGRLGSYMFGLLSAGGLQGAGVYLQLNGRYGGTWGGLSLNPGVPQSSAAAEWLTRYTGFALNPNNMGLIAGASTVALLVLAVAPGAVRPRVACILFSLAFFYLVLLSNSRTALVATGVGVVVGLLLTSVRAAVIGITAMSVATVLLLTSTWAQIEVLLQSLGGIASATDDSYLARISLWSDYLSHVHGVEVVIGRGFGAVNPDLYDHVSSIGVDQSLLKAGTVDNSWIKLVIEGGVFLAVLMALIISLSAWSGFEGYRLSRLHGIQTTGYVVPLSLFPMMIWASASYDVFDINPWNGLIWVLVGLCYLTPDWKLRSEGGGRAVGPRGSDGSSIRWPVA